MANEAGNSSWPLGVCILPAPPPNAARTVVYPAYMEEILAHAGICRRSITLDTLDEMLPRIGILLTVGDAQLAPELAAAVRAWVEGGGAWISVGGTCGCEDLFGVEPEPPAYVGFGAGTGTLGEGYLDPECSESLVTAPIRIPLHFFSGKPVLDRGCSVLARVLDAHGKPTDRVAVAEQTVGKGKCLLIAPDVTGTIVRVQQGLGVTRDGVSAGDGTAPVADQVLKSGDGGVLDWILDREPVEGAPGFSAFLRAVADEWRDLVLRSLFLLAYERGIALPLLWLYPRGLPALGHLSHDTDGNDPGAAIQLLKTLDEAGAPGSWCVIMPGYAPALINSIRAAGHELAMHFDAMSDGTRFDRADFDEQHRGLTALFGGTAPTSNKNHYLRWEGDCDLFDWCAEHGIQIDESKGASKTGEAGFNFGTCHPYFPVRFSGEPIDVLELCTPTQDLLVFAPEALRNPLIDAALRHHGVAHFLFHPAHVARPGVADALKAAVRAGKDRGMEWWTAAQINTWERARRTFRWLSCRQEAGRIDLDVEAGAALAEATFLVLDTGGPLSESRESPLGTDECVRWGFRFQTFHTDIEPGAPVRIELSER